MYFPHFFSVLILSFILINFSLALLMTSQLMFGLETTKPLRGSRVLGRVDDCTHYNIVSRVDLSLKHPRFRLCLKNYSVDKCMMFSLRVLLYFIFFGISCKPFV